MSFRVVAARAVVFTPLGKDHHSYSRSVHYGFFNNSCYFYVGIHINSPHVLTFERHMFYPVTFLFPFGIIESVKITYQVSGNPPYPFKFDFSFFTTAVRTCITNSSAISAYRISVYRMVNCTIAYAGFLHRSDNFLKSLQVLRWITIHLNISNMSCIGQPMVWCFNSYLIKSINFVVYRNMEAVRVIFPVSSTFYGTIYFSVHFHKSSCQSFSRSCQKGEVHFTFLASLVHTFTHMTNYF